MRWEQLCELARALPGVTVETWYGTPAFKVGGKGFARLKEDRASVMFVVDSLDAQEALIAALPDVYFITDHYKGYPAVLARLAALSPAAARERLQHAWEQKAGDAMIAGRPGKSASRAHKPRARRRT